MTFDHVSHAFLWHGMRHDNMTWPAMSCCNIQHAMSCCNIQHAMSCCNIQHAMSCCSPSTCCVTTYHVVTTCNVTTPHVVSVTTCPPHDVSLHVACHTTTDMLCHHTTWCVHQMMCHHTTCMLWFKYRILCSRTHLKNIWYTATKKGLNYLTLCSDIPTKACDPGGIAVPRLVTAGISIWSCTIRRIPAPWFGPFIYSYCSIFMRNLSPPSGPGMHK
jgi:hypothetical protein